MKTDEIICLYLDKEKLKKIEASNILSENTCPIKNKQQF